jgi:hypothetical protein
MQTDSLTLEIIRPDGTRLYITGYTPTPAEFAAAPRWACTHCGAVAIDNGQHKCGWCSFVREVSA